MDFLRHINNPGINIHDILTKLCTALQFEFIHYFSMKKVEVRGTDLSVKMATLFDEERNFEEFI